LGNTGKVSNLMGISRCLITKERMHFWWKFWNFSFEIHLILWSHTIVFPFECQAWIIIADI
jgi:hypothetical protein